MLTHPHTPHTPTPPPPPRPPHPPPPPPHTPPTPPPHPHPPHPTPTPQPPPPTPPHPKKVSRLDSELVQDRRNSSASAMELRLSCTNPSILTHILTLRGFTKCQHLRQANFCALSHPVLFRTTATQHTEVTDQLRVIGPQRLLRPAVMVCVEVITQHPFVERGVNASLHDVSCVFGKTVLELFPSVMYPSRVPVAPLVTMPCAYGYGGQYCVCHNGSVTSQSDTTIAPQRHGYHATGLFH